MKVKIVQSSFRYSSSDSFQRGQDIEVAGNLCGTDERDQSGCNLQMSTVDYRFTLYFDSEDDAVAFVDAAHQVAHAMVAKRQARNASKLRPVDVVEEMAEIGTSGA